MALLDKKKRNKINQIKSNQNDKCKNKEARKVQSRCWIYPFAGGACSRQERESENEDCEHVVNDKNWIITVCGLEKKNAEDTSNTRKNVSPRGAKRSGLLARAPFFKNRFLHFLYFLFFDIWPLRSLDVTRHVATTISTTTTTATTTTTTTTANATTTATTDA